MSRILDDMEEHDQTIERLRGIIDRRTEWHAPFIGANWQVVNRAIIDDLKDLVWELQVNKESQQHTPRRLQYKCDQLERENLYLHKQLDAVEGMMKEIFARVLLLESPTTGGESPTQGNEKVKNNE